MAFGKIRLRDREEDSVDDRPDEKRMRSSLPLFIEGAVATEKIQKFCLTLEPFLRKAVHDELERSLSKHGHLLYTSPSLLLNEAEKTPSLKLAFTRPLLLPIFTNNQLLDVQNNPLQVRLLDTRTNSYSRMTHHFGSPTKLEVLVLDGDFRYEDSSEEGWTSEEFDGAIVRERQGRRPLLVGSPNVTMAEHGVTVIDDVSFTDNSSWIRSRRFRIGVRPVPGSYHGPRIQEAVSESFMVKDHRGELYKKHFPPHLADDVWRLKNIRKEGPIHKRLESEDIRTVQDFMKQYFINPEKLKKLVGMSDRLWKTTLHHAKTCDMEGKCYIFRPEMCEITLILSPVCEIMEARIGDKLCSLQELHPKQMLQVKQLAAQAYQQWDQLEEADTSWMVSDARNDQTIASMAGNLKLAEKISVPDNSPVLELSESQDEGMSSGGPHDTTGGTTATSGSTAAPAVGTTAAAAYWSPCMESDDNLIIWKSLQFSVNQLE